MVVIICASEQDKDQAEKICSILKAYAVQYKVHFASAHKVPELVLKIIEKYNKKDKPVCFITIVGRSNGLSGLVAANAQWPVLACPVFSDKADYLVNIHSSLQMPSETPAMTIIQPENVALAALRIVAMSNHKLRKNIREQIDKMKKKFNKASD